MAIPTIDRDTDDRATEGRATDDRGAFAPRTTARGARDRFDAVPEDLHRVGAHRAKAHWARGWLNVAWAVGAILVLSVGGLWGLSQINSDFEFGLPFLSGPEQEEIAEVPADETPE